MQQLQQLLQEALPAGRHPQPSLLWFALQELQVQLLCSQVLRSRSVVRLRSRSGLRLRSRSVVRLPAFLQQLLQEALPRWPAGSPVQPQVLLQQLQFLQQLQQLQHLRL